MQASDAERDAPKERADSAGRARVEGAHDGAPLLDRRATRLALLAIVVLAAAVRLPGLDVVPNGLWCDEASTGYDAYSMLETGRDQFGEPMPLFARSFGDYNESLYRFVVIPFVAVLGLDEVAVRLPAAIAGVLTVVGLFFLARRLFGRDAALLAALLLALSPWHVHFSRIAFRGILLPLVLTWGLHAFVSAYERPRRLLLAGGLLALSLYTYSPARVFVPALVAVLAASSWRLLRANPRMAAAGGAIFAVVLGALALLWTSPEGLARAQATLKTSPVEILQGYLSYLDPRFLFWSGDPSELNSPLGVGQLHLFEALTVPVGIAWVVVRGGRARWLLLAWLLLYPLPAALTDSPNALRSIVGAPLFALLSAAGIMATTRWFGHRISSGGARRAAAAVSLSVVLGSGAVYAKRYFVDYPIQSATMWDYGLREAFAAIRKADPPCVVVSDRFFLSYIFILFYMEIPPATYQQNPVQGVRQGHWNAGSVDIGRFHVRNLRSLRMTQGRCLFMTRPGEIATVARNGHAVSEIYRIHAPDGLPVISLLDVAAPPTPP